MTEAQQLTNTIALGFDVEAFLSSSVGRYIKQQAENDRTDALEALGTEVDPEDGKSVRALQNKVAVADSIMQWLADAIQDGRAAAQQYQDLIDQQ